MNLLYFWGEKLQRLASDPVLHESAAYFRLAIFHKLKGGGGGNKAVDDHHPFASFIATKSSPCQMCHLTCQAKLSFQAILVVLSPLSGGG